MHIYVWMDIHAKNSVFHNSPECYITSDITVTIKIFSQESFYFIFVIFSLSWILKISFSFYCILF